MDYNKTKSNNQKIITNVVDDEAVAMQFLQHQKVDAVISHSDVAENYKKLADNKIITKGCQDVKRTNDSGCHILFSKKNAKRFERYNKQRNKQSYRYW